MGQWVDPDNPDRNEWCPTLVDQLPTGDGVACGRFATVKLKQGDRAWWVCETCASWYRWQSEGIPP
jgi:hypothetical protein